MEKKIKIILKDWDQLVQKVLDDSHEFHSLVHSGPAWVP